MERFHFTLQPRERVVVMVAVLFIVAYSAFQIGSAHGRAVEHQYCEGVRQEQIAHPTPLEGASAQQEYCFGYTR